MTSSAVPTPLGAEPSHERMFVTTRPIADPVELLARLPQTDPVAWVRGGEGLIGWGVAARFSDGESLTNTADGAATGCDGAAGSTGVAAGDSIDPLDVLRGAGVDLGSPEPVEQTFAVLSSLVDRIEELVPA